MRQASGAQATTLPAGGAREAARSSHNCAPHSHEEQVGEAAAARAGFNPRPRKSGTKRAGPIRIPGAMYSAAMCGKTCSSLDGRPPEQGRDSGRRPMRISAATGVRPVRTITTLIGLERVDHAPEHDGGSRQIGVACENLRLPVECRQTLVGEVAPGWEVGLNGRQRCLGVDWRRDWGCLQTKRRRLHPRPHPS